MNSFSLSDVHSDLLTAQEYSEWLKQSVQTTYSQIRRGTLLVPAWSSTPLRWRVVDCQSALQRTHAVQQKSERLRKKFRKAHAA